MPYKSSYRKKRYARPAKRAYNRRRKVVKKRSYKKFNKMSVRTMGVMVPDKARIKFRYNDSVQAMNISGTSHWYVQYKANDILNPGSLNSGVSASYQSNGVTEWQGFYSKFKVNACKIKFRILNAVVSGVNTDLIFKQCVLRPCTEGTLTQYTNDVVSQAATDKYAKSGIIGSMTGGNSSLTLSHYMTTKKLYGYRYNNLDTSESFVGQLGASAAIPSELWYWLLTVGPFDNTFAASTAAEVFLQVSMTFYCDLFDRIDTDMEYNPL